jgi:alanine-glyoxylate transaminase/serine-glyoxylate transaminase/serine-pyruvate transaminase
MAFESQAVLAAESMLRREEERHPYECDGLSVCRDSAPTSGSSIAHQQGCLVIVDAIYSGSQKCLSCAPGQSPVSISEAAIQRTKGRKTQVQSWFMDPNLVMGYWGAGVKRPYHHTTPVSALYGLHESLVVVQEEGLEIAWARHQANHLALRAETEAMGLNFMVRGRLLNEFDLVIGAGLGALAGKVWRIGHASKAKNVMFCLGVLDRVLTDMAAPIEGGVAVAATKGVIG